MPGLTAKQAQFVREYLIDLNATQAAIRCGYSAKTAYSQGQRLLKDVEVAAEIDRLKIERMGRIEVDADYVLRRLYEMAEADRADLYDESGALLPVREWPEVWRKGMVTGIEVNELWEGRGDDREIIGQVKKIRTETPLAILQTIGKHIKVNAFQDIVQHKGLEGLAERMERAAKRGG